MFVDASDDHIRAFQNNFQRGGLLLSIALGTLSGCAMHHAQEPTLESDVPDDSGTSARGACRDGGCADGTWVDAGPRRNTPEPVEPAPPQPDCSEAQNTLESFQMPTGDFAASVDARVLRIDETGIYIESPESGEMFVPANGLDFEAWFTVGEPLSVDVYDSRFPRSVRIVGEHGRLVTSAQVPFYSSLGVYLWSGVRVDGREVSCSYRSPEYGGYEHSYGGIRARNELGQSASGPIGEVFEFEGWQIVGATHRAQVLGGGAGYIPETFMMGVGPGGL